MFKQAMKSLVAVAAIAAAASASAVPVTLTTGDSTINNWGGFDWASNGTAVVTGYNPFVDSDFNLTFWAKAVTLTDGNGNVAEALTGKSFEYTVVFTLAEHSHLLGGGQALFSTLAGHFDIYYDTSANSDQVTGAGFSDGTLLVSGDAYAGPNGTFTATSLTDGFGSSTILGNVAYTNTTYINPALSGTNAQTTLQIGQFVTNWVAPTGVPIAGGGSTALPQGSIAFQADANQTFKAPEPGSLALLGLALGGIALARRRK